MNFSIGIDISSQSEVKICSEIVVIWFIFTFILNSYLSSWVIWPAVCQFFSLIFNSFYVRAPWRRLHVTCQIVISLAVSTVFKLSMSKSASLLTVKIMVK